MSRNKQTRRPTLNNDGFMSRFGYFLSRAVMNIRQNAFANVITVSTITLALLIIAVFLLIFTNLEGVADEWSTRMQVAVYFDRELPLQEINVLKGKIQALQGTDKVVYISRDEAMKRFRQRLKGQETLLDGVSSEVLPASLEIGLKRGFRNGDFIEAYAAQLKKIPEVKEIQYGADWVRRFTTFLSFLRFVCLLVGLFLLLAVVFIVSNTIKLTIYARKDEIELLDLVGASGFFIRAPFMLEGIIQGAAGAAFAMAILGVAYFALIHNVGNFLSFDPANFGLRFLSFPQLVSLFAGGTGLGFLGSLTSIKRFVTL